VREQAPHKQQPGKPHRAAREIVGPVLVTADGRERQPQDEIDGEGAEVERRGTLHPKGGDATTGRTERPRAYYHSSATRTTVVTDAAKVAQALARAAGSSNPTFTSSSRWRMPEYRCCSSSHRASSARSRPGTLPRTACTRA